MLSDTTRDVIGLIGLAIGVISLGLSVVQIKLANYRPAQVSATTPRAQQRWHLMRLGLIPAALLVLTLIAGWAAANTVGSVRDFIFIAGATTATLQFLTFGYWCDSLERVLAAKGYIKKNSDPVAIAGLILYGAWALIWALVVYLRSSPNWLVDFAIMQVLAVGIAVLCAAPVIYDELTSKKK
jgi:hypothetical protein